MNKQAAAHRSDTVTVYNHSIQALFTSDSTVEASECSGGGAGGAKWSVPFECFGGIYSRNRG